MRHLFLLLLLARFSLVVNIRCPQAEKISDCFRGIIGLDPEIPECLKFDYLEKCFSYESRLCPIKLIAEIASDTYLTDQQRVIPAVLVVQMHQKLKLKCRKATAECSNRDMDLCVRAMNQEQLLHDEKYAADYQASLLSLRKRQPTHTLGCQDARSALNMWANFRKDQCGPVFAACLCILEEPGLKSLGCPVQCANANSSGIRRPRNSNSGDRPLTFGIAVFLSTVFLHRLG